MCLRSKPKNFAKAAPMKDAAGALYCQRTMNKCGENFDVQARRATEERAIDARQAGIRRSCGKYEKSRHLFRCGLF